MATSTPPRPNSSAYDKPVSSAVNDANGGQANENANRAELCQDLLSIDELLLPHVAEKAGLSSPGRSGSPYALRRNRASEKSMKRDVRDPRSGRVGSRNRRLSISD